MKVLVYETTPGGAVAVMSFNMQKWDRQRKRVEKAHLDHTAAWSARVATAKQLRLQQKDGRRAAQTAEETEAAPDAPADLVLGDDEMIQAIAAEALPPGAVWVVVDDAALPPDDVLDDKVPPEQAAVLQHNRRRWRIAGGRVVLGADS